ncbi:MAG: proline--tRNA ligase, partial [Bacteroidales bacterium]|nr:proline--tRNA ligase [Bacteroidales bacterium]
VWASSWGVSTRLMGALVMAHSDDNGLVLPPRLAPIQVVIVPIYKSKEQLQTISLTALEIEGKLKAKGISVKFDDRDTHKPGWKFAEYELKGVPVRLAIGPRDLENNAVEVARRDTLEKKTMPIGGIDTYVANLLEDIQQNIYQKALDYKRDHTTEVNGFDEFIDVLDNKGGFVLAHWDGTGETEQKIKELTKATIRCIPEDAIDEAGTCVLSGRPSQRRVLFARAY